MSRVKKPKKKYVWKKEYTAPVRWKDIPADPGIRVTKAHVDRLYTLIYSGVAVFSVK